MLCGARVRQDRIIMEYAALTAKTQRLESPRDPEQ